MSLKSVLIGGAAASALCLAAPAVAADYYLTVFGGINSVDGDDLRFGPVTYSSLAYKNTGTIKGSFGTLVFNSGTGQWRIFNGYANNTFVSSLFAFTYAGGFAEDEFDGGFVVGIGLGRDFGDGWRAELELAWRQNDMGQNHAITGYQSSQFQTNASRFLTGTAIYKTAGGAGATVTSGVYTSANPLAFYFTSKTSTSVPLSATARASGEVTSFALMANVWYDFDLEGSPITPFVGVGIGGVNLGVEYTARAVLPTNTAGAIPGYTTIQNTILISTDTDEWTWGWQAAAGLTYEFGNGMSLSAQYRYFSTGDITVFGQDFGVDSHEGLIGLRMPLGN